MGGKKDRRNPKLDALLEEGTLNPAPGKVSDPKFRDSEFFDPHDAVQVKYEMLRRVLTEGASITETTDTFGYSRPSFYKARQDFEDEGLVGLIPRRRGPRSAHKLTDEIMDFLEQELASDLAPSVETLVERVRTHFGLSIHRRSVERALQRRKRKHQ